MSKYVKNLMINEFKLRELGTDFMGYDFRHEGDNYTYHHLIIPRRVYKANELGDGVTRDNGAIIFKNPHEYLHVVERYDYDRFLAITSEMIDENIKGYVDFDNLKNIDDILRGFEREYSGVYTKKGKVLIKEDYTKRLILKK